MLDGCGGLITGADTHGLRDVSDDDEPIALVPGMGCDSDGFYDRGGNLVRTDHFNEFFLVEENFLFGDAISAALTATAALPSDIENADSRKMRQGMERLHDTPEDVWLDECFYFFHGKYVS